jgi:hypothetical protein
VFISELELGGGARAAIIIGIFFFFSFIASIMILHRWLRYLRRKKKGLVSG